MIVKPILKLFILSIKHLDIFQVIFFRNIRWWLYRKYYNASKLYVDTNVDISSAHVNRDSYFKVLGKVNIGKGVYIDYSGGVEIGNAIAISSGAKIFTHNHNINGKFKDWHKNGITYSNIKIEDYVWIGSNVLVMPSVTLIAEGSIIGAGSVLTKSTEPYGVYVGNPARKITERKIEK